jgi:hypothetical protein
MWRATSRLGGRILRYTAAAAYQRARAWFDSVWFGIAREFQYDRRRSDTHTVDLPTYGGRVCSQASTWTTDEDIHDRTTLICVYAHDR